MSGARPEAPPASDLHARLQGGPLQEDATRELHALLLRAARFEIGRRSEQLRQVRGEDADDLALQAADDAFVAVMAKLGEFRGESRFTTWAYKFALYEAAVRVRRRSWQHREVVLEPERWLAVGDTGHSPESQREARLLGPAEEEASCDECFALLDRFVDIEVATGDAEARMPALAAHLRGCPACAEDHASLRDYVLSTSRSVSGSGADRPAE